MDLYRSIIKKKHIHLTNEQLAGEEIENIRTYYWIIYFSHLNAEIPFSRFEEEGIVKKKVSKISEMNKDQLLQKIEIWNKLWLNHI